MTKIRIGNINGNIIYTGNTNEIKNGDYYISIVGGKPAGLFVKKNGKLVPICQCGKEEESQKELNLQEVNILTGYHGKKENVAPAEGYDGICKVTYRKPKLEEKDAVKITKNGVTEIKIGKGYDGLDDITVIVNVEK